ncbi:sperm microtubule associated protein 1-like [Oscarella lobularis]|uniref:sperm microtubule associated protein 1-like n=1 Tax=Oscarella lobularis TaxID=121494 RepID=UPI00331369BC
MPQKNDDAADRPTPSRKWGRPMSPEKRRGLEMNFVLDGVALSKQANDDARRTNPSINIGIPQYQAQRDKHAQSYFVTKPAKTSLKTTRQDSEPSTVMGKVYDRFTKRCHSATYLRERKEIHQAGHSYAATVAGHTTVPTLPPLNGYNGPDGYRRNTFALRQRPSDFGFPSSFRRPRTAKN